MIRGSTGHPLFTRRALPTATIARQPQRQSDLRQILGWFDGNPANLHTLPPTEAAAKYVEFMGGADAVLAKAREAFAAGEYRRVAEVVNHVVFADPDNQEARGLQADVLEQLGYRSEAGTWRNLYLTEAKELRDGVLDIPFGGSAGPDSVKAMTLELLFNTSG